MPLVKKSSEIETQIKFRTKEALRVFPAVTRLTVYRRRLVPEQSDLTRRAFSLSPRA